MRGMTRRAPPTEGPEAALTRRGRVVALVMAGAMLGWLLLQWAGAALGWPVGLVFVFDALALLAFVWALAETYRIWRRRRELRG